MKTEKIIFLCFLLFFIIKLEKLEKNSRYRILQTIITLIKRKFINKIIVECCEQIDLKIKIFNEIKEY